MSPTQELLIQRINRIRKLKQISVHDCASILGISKEQFLQLESGAQLLTLPEIILLSIYFGVPMTAFFDETAVEMEVLSLLDDNIRSNFIQLLQKVIITKLTIEMEEQNVTANDLHLATNIPLETIQSYKTGNSSIPIENLSKIAAYLNIPVETMLDQEMKTIFNREQHSKNAQWQPEYPKPHLSLEGSENEPLDNLFMALRSLPKEDQALMSKFLLEKLKTL